VPPAPSDRATSREQPRLDEATAGQGPNPRHEAIRALFIVGPDIRRVAIWFVWTATVTTDA
jgi:hypothetical protein